MSSLSISKAWEEGSRFAAKEFRLLFPIIFLFVVVPQLVLTLLIPPENSVEMVRVAEFVQRNGMGTVLLIAVAVGLVTFALQTLASLAISYLALRPGASVGESFSAALRGLPSVMGAFLLIGLAFALAMVPMFLLVLPTAPVGGAAAVGMVGMALVFIILMLVAIAVVAAKLLPLVPAGSVENLGPLALIRRSWTLTTGHFWSILGTILLFGLIYTVMMGMIGVMVGLLVFATIGNPEVNHTALFVMDMILALIGCVVTIFILCFFARIYAQLSGRTQEVGQVFE